VAEFTRSREPGSSVCGSRCPGVILLVTGEARRAIQRVVIVQMAISALARRDCVRAGQRKARRGVVELAIGPPHSVVTTLACCRESRVGHRAGRAGVVLLVTREARRTVQRIVIINVAIRALTRRDGVSTGQWEPGAGVVERRAQPSCGVMAGAASLRKICGRMVWARRTGIVLLMAPVTRGAVQRVVAVDMAVRALSRRNSVHSGKGKARLVVIE